MRRSAVGGLLGPVVTVAALLLSGCTSSAPPVTEPESALDTSTRSDPRTARQQVDALLNARAEAIVAADRRAFLATSLCRVDANDSACDEPDQAGSAVADQQRALSQLPWSRWQYAVDEVSVVTTADRPTLRVTAVARARIAGVDSVDSEQRLLLDLVRTDSGWRVAHERGDDRPAWWEEGVAAVQSDTGLVVGLGDIPMPELREAASAQERAMRSATATLGRSAPRPWVLVVPADGLSMAAMLGRPPQAISALAAVTVPSASGQAGAERIWLNREAFAPLDAAARDIVLRHESAHLILGSTTSSGAPMWMEEGLAQYVGYRGSGVPVSTAAGDVVAEVVAGRVPRELPLDARFDGRDSRMAAAYGEALTATVWLADAIGWQELLSVYDQMAAGGGAAGARLERLLQRQGLSTSALVAGWRRALTAWSQSSGPRL